MRISHAERRNGQMKRGEEMAALYRGGMTLQDIGTAYGITRERVRQLLKLVGVSGYDGGVHVRSVENKKRKAAALAERRAIHSKRILAIYGCTRAEALALNGELLSRRGTKARGFFDQRRNAAVRGIAWNFTFKSWLAVWADSGRLEDRGRGHNRNYVMARYGDVGAYEPGNVYITTNSNNASDYQAELKVRGVRCADGYMRLPERAEALQLIG